MLNVLEAKARAYEPLVDFATRRVAVLGLEDDLRPDRNRTMDRHTDL